MKKRRGKLKGGNLSAVLRGGNGADDESTKRVVEAMVKKIRWWGAAEIIGVTDRTMRRWRERLGVFGVRRAEKNNGTDHV
jgi:hypothetical protein